MPGKRWIVVALAVATLGSACTSGLAPTPSPGPARSPTHSSSPLASPSPATGPSSTTPRVIDALWPFAALYSKPLDDSYTYSDGEYLVTSDRWDDGRNLVVTRVGSAEPILDHVATAGFRTEDVYLQEPWLVVKELPADDTSAEIRLFRYHLDSGDRVDVSQRDLPRPTEPEMALHEDHLYYLTGSSRTRKCLIDLELKRLTARTLYCGATGWVVEDPKATASGLVLSEVRPGPEHRCKRLVVIPVGGKPRRDLAAPIRNCQQWSGYLVDATVAWDEIDPTEPEVDLGEATLHARTGRGEAVVLGEVYTDSMIACAGWFYWTVQGEEEVRRWRPGSEIEVVFRATVGGGAVVGRATCGTDKLILPVHDTDPDGGQETWYAARRR